MNIVNRYRVLYNFYMNYGLTEFYIKCEYYGLVQITHIMVIVTQMTEHSFRRLRGLICLI